MPSPLHTRPTRQRGRAALRVEALEDRWLLSGGVRLTACFGQFHRPVSVIALGPAVATALTILSPFDPWAPFQRGPGNQSVGGLVAQESAAAPPAGAPAALAPAPATLAVVAGAGTVLPQELLEVVANGRAATAAPDGLLPA